MKNLLKSALVAVCILSVSGFAKAQSKIGYLNFQDLVIATPQYKTIQAQIEKTSKEYSDVLQNMQNELQKNASDYEGKRATMSDALRTKTEGELQDQNKRVQDYNQTAQNAVTQKSNELYKPLVDNLKAAVSQVAKEKGYNYIIDSSQTQLLVSPEGDNIMEAVKVKLGPSFAGGAATATTPAKTPATKKP